MDRSGKKWVRRLDGAVHNFNGHSLDRRRFYSFMVWQFEQPQSERPDVKSIREELKARIGDQDWVNQLVADFECCNGLLEELRSPIFKDW